MAIGGQSPYAGQAIASTLVDLHAGERPAHSVDQILLKEHWTPGWRDWLIVGIGVAMVVVTVAFLITLR